MRTYVRMLVACVLIPRFELAVAAGGLEALAGRAVAIAPEGSSGPIGEVSGAAQAFGVRSGMALGEALARCPHAGAARGRPGRRRRRLGAHAAHARGDRRRRRAPAPGPRLLRARRAARPARRQRRARARGGAARARPPRPPGGRADPLLRPGGRARDPPPAHADRPRRRARAPRAAAGRAAALARRHRAAGGDPRAARDRDARRARGARRAPRSPTASARRASRRTGSPAARTTRPARGRIETRLVESLELPESAGGQALERALEVLIDRLLARPERRGRTLRAATLAARLVDGGSWRSGVTFREALADPQRMRLVLAPRLALLPSPASVLALAAERFGPPAGEQRRAPRPGRRGPPRAAAARRSARCAAPPDPTPRCASTGSSPTRASPSGARCSPRTGR